MRRLAESGTLASIHLVDLPDTYLSVDHWQIVDCHNLCPSSASSGGRRGSHVYSLSTPLTMWLLDTHTLKLHHFVSPEAVKEGYVILSHRWNAQEQSFQDLQEVHEWCNRSGDDPHDLVTDKIRRFCELAEAHGYQWAWIDTCCIDKTSSAELEEAINAMFRFYS
ncbi:hypothetical protein C8Q76DRAFT_861563 [Earliella scabrosa]|nr:hypothetical protein C8Q76DRAFT_861563 [Earliella scabrosa]